MNNRLEEDILHERLKQAFANISVVNKDSDSIGSNSVLVGTIFDIDDPETFPPNNFPGRMIWALPKIEKSISKSLSLFRDLGVEYVLADYIPDEFGDIIYGEHTRWFYKRWIFWPCKWIDSTFEPAPLIYDFNTKLEYPKAKSYDPYLEAYTPAQKAYNSCGLVRIYNSSENWGSLNSDQDTKPILTTALCSSIYLEGMFLTGARIVHLGPLKSPFLNLIFGIENCADNYSLRKIYKKWISPPNEAEQSLISLLSTNHLEFLKFSLFNVDQSLAVRGSFSSLSKPLDQSSATGLPFSAFCVSPNYISDVPFWQKSLTERRKFLLSTIVFCKHRSPRTLELIYGFINDLIAQKHFSFEMQAVFRTVFIHCRDFESICLNAIEEFKISNQISAKTLYGNLCSIVLSSLFQKMPTEEVDSKIIQFCTDLSRKEESILKSSSKINICSLLIAAETGNWRVVDTVLPAKSYHCVEDSLLKRIAQSAFRQRQFDRAYAYFESLSQVEKKEYNWEHVISSAIVVGIQCAYGELDRIYDELKGSMGMGTIAAQNFFFEQPNLFLEEDGKPLAEAPWNILLNLIRFDIKNVKDTPTCRRYYTIFTTLGRSPKLMRDEGNLGENDYSKNAWILPFEWLNGAGNINCDSDDVRRYLKNVENELDLSLFLLGALFLGDHLLLDCFQQSVQQKKYPIDLCHNDLFFQLFLGVFYTSKGDAAALKVWNDEFVTHYNFHPFFKKMLTGIKDRKDNKINESDHYEGFVFMQ